MKTVKEIAMNFSLSIMLMSSMDLQFSAYIALEKVEEKGTQA